ncbi:Uncharacterised protein [Serratia rubidaea]|uniref:Uncharacterized protein n=1 Tax=Serratia rubidaea TaxID=61652 RepID=A0A4U9HC04_SERRU|nr:Uncharacterised protein [Serratia rubidaea]
MTDNSVRLVVRAGILTLALLGARPANRLNPTPPPSRSRRRPSSRSVSSARPNVYSSASRR